MTNEYGEHLDANGYRESLLESGGLCWYCRRGGDLARHEAFEGTGRRDKAKRLGLWVTVCPTCHALCHEHPKSGVALMLKQFAQKSAMDEYGWSKQRFIAEFGMSYFMEDEEQ